MTQVDMRRLQNLNSTQLAGRLRILTYDALADWISEYNEEQITRLQLSHENLVQFKSIKEWVEHIDRGGGQ